MDSQRSFLVIALIVVSFLLFQQWQLDYNQPQQSESQISVDQIMDTPTDNQSDVPLGDSQPVVETRSERKMVTVKTDVLELTIDTLGGDIVSAKLPTYPTEQNGDIPFTLLETTQGFNYVAQSGLVGRDGPDATKKPIYSVEKEEFILEGESLEVPFTFINNQGLSVTKRFVFKPGHFDVKVMHEVQNTSDSVKQVVLYGQLKQSTNNSAEGSMIMPTYRGAAYSTHDERYEKYDFDDIADANLKKTTQGGWVAMLQHYFVAAWVPAADQQNKLFTRLFKGNQAIIGFKSSDPIDIQAGETKTLSASLFVGPKDQDAMKSLSDTLDLTVDYGFLWWLSQPLFALLTMIQGVVVNWGLAIIVITIIVKSLLYPLTKAQYVSMAKLKKLQPKMQQLKERYGDDRQRMSQAMMELYRKEKVNPAGGCLPLLLQMPIFLALYWVFLESVELRHAAFGLWINDLSAPDPFYILPILMGASMYLMQKLQPTAMTDPMQQKIMQLMPVFMTVFFLMFPSGLVLYWLVSNLISIAQMVYINKSIEKAAE